MGVYLPNVDMPKGDKVLTIQICPDGSIWQQYRGTVPNAKAVPVPPHGRCIDADALVNKHFGKEYLSKIMTADEDDMGTALVNIPLVINNAPTILEAEEETND